ncbi:MAG: hypothetical protein RLZZ584_3649, partial [Pseudomonadota bacterium]
AAASASAGSLLRSLREAQGMDLDRLAQALKVPSRKLELLEADRYDALPGMAFVRSLSLAVCRQLGADATPVLALLPAAAGMQAELEHVTRGLAAPFRDGGANGDLRQVGPAGLLKLSWLVPAGLLVAALVFWFLPDLRSAAGQLGAHLPQSSAPAAPAASGVSQVDGDAGGAMLSPGVAVGGASAPPLPASAVVETVFSAPVEVGQSAASAAVAAPAVAGSLVLRTTAASWVEVSDGANRLLLSRMLTPGETVGLDGALPMRAKIGNAAGTEVSFRGRPVDLVPLTRENVARLELK